MFSDLDARRSTTVLLLLFIWIFSSRTITAQTIIGLQPMGSYEGQLDKINLSDLGIHIDIPLYQHQTTRGGMSGVGAHLIYDSSYADDGMSGWDSYANVGWRVIAGTTIDGSVVIKSEGNIPCTGPNPNQNYGTVNFYFYEFVDANGYVHPFGEATYNACNDNGQTGANNPPSVPLNATALDGSGYVIAASGISAVVTSPSGIKYSTLVNSGNTTKTDTNGNVTTYSYDLANSAAGYANGSSSTLTDISGISLNVSGGGYPNFNNRNVPVTSRNPVYLGYTDANGNPQQIVISYKMYNIYPKIYEGTATPAPTGLVDTVTFPDGSIYHFTYQASPFYSGASSGELASIQLPTGGTITYSSSWSQSTSNGVTVISPEVVTRTTSDGATTYTRTINSTSSNGYAATTTSVARPDQSTETIQFVNTPQVFDYDTEYHNLETAHYWKNAAGSTLKSTTRCYNGATTSCATSPITLPISQISLTTTLDTKSSQVVRSFNANGLPAEVDEYDFGASSPTRKTVTTYASLGNNILDRPHSVVVSDSAGHTVSETTFGYDESISCGGIANVTGTRGNQTSAHPWISLAGSTLDSSNCYDQYGQLAASTDPNGTTKYGYDSTDTYLTSVTPPTPSSGVSLSVSSTYDEATGLLTSTTDLNGTKTSYSSYDSMLRPIEIDKHDSSNNMVGKTTYASYSTQDKSTAVFQSASVPTNTSTLLDGYGRHGRTAVFNGQSGNQWYQQDTCYDANGNIGFQSYVYQGTEWGTAKVCTGSGDSYTYDALGRVKSVTHSGGSNVQYYYTGRATQITDENGVSRITQVDGLGRTTFVCEISSSSLQGDSPSACGLDIVGTGYLTTYSYDLANHKTTIIQGAQTRVFQTDWLGRTILTQEPERGQTTYSYAYNGTGLQVTRTRPKANQGNSNTTTTTITQYDALGRKLSISYSDGTPTKTFMYDQPNIFGGGISAGASKGRLTTHSVNISGNPAATAYEYDAIGRVGATVQCFPFDCANSAHYKWTDYSYDWASNLTGESDPTIGNIGYSYSPANEVTQITGSYSIDGSTSGGAYSLLTSTQYGPNGPTLYTFGNDVSMNQSYDQMGRPIAHWVCYDSTQPACPGGTYIYGNILAYTGTNITDVSDSAINQHRGYIDDEFNRLKTMSSVDTGQQLYSYVYDRYGNRWQQNALQGGGSSFSGSFDKTTNRLSSTGYGYDAAGNMTSDGIHSYTYDAEGNITQVDAGSTASYTYDALNRRIRVQNSSQTVDYTFDYLNRRVTTWQESNDVGIHGKIYWGSSNLPVAFRAINGQTYFEHLDWLGTERADTNYSGVSTGVFGSLPFGDGFSVSGTDGDPYHFAILDHDSETDTHHAQYRQYSSAQGRWLSPDPYDGSYDFSNPQSFNRYSYVLNNPLSFSDPSGMDCVTDNGDGTVLTNTGDCANENEEAANHEYYINCDGCTSSATGANLDQATGSLYLTDSNGNGTAGTTVEDFADAQGTPATSVSVNGYAPYLDTISGWGIPPDIDSQRIQQLSSGIAHFGIPNVCGIGVNVRGGAGRISVGVDLSTNKGLRPAVGARLVSMGPFSGTFTMKGGSESAGINARIPGTPYSAGVGFSGGGVITSANVSARFGLVSAQVYASISNFGDPSCH